MYLLYQILLFYVISTCSASGYPPSTNTNNVSELLDSPEKINIVQQENDKSVKLQDERVTQNIQVNSLASNIAHIRKYFRFRRDAYSHTNTDETYTQDVNTSYEGHEAPEIDSPTTDPLLTLAMELEEHPPEKSLVQEFFDKSQLTMLIIGVIANGVTVITLFKNGKDFQSSILVLLRHQSVIDAWICVIGIAMLVQPVMWNTGNLIADTFVCHVWHGQAIYFGSLFLSVYNLVTIAFERYLAVCQPFSHKEFSKAKIYVLLIILYFLNFIIVSPGYIQVRMEGGHCIPEVSVKGKAGQILFYGYSIVSFLVWYAIPTSMFILLYGMVIFTFKKRQSDGKFSTSRVIDRATTELTKTAVAVTAIFIGTIGYDCWYYVLGHTGVVVYKKNSPIQKIGLWLATFNSVANPFVYALLMPTYRLSVKKTFFCEPKTLIARSETSIGTVITTVADE